MSSENAQPTAATINAALAAEGLPPFNQLVLALANGVMAAYNAYQYGTTPVLPGYTYVASIWVQESALEGAAGDSPSPTPPAISPGPEAGLPPWKGNTLLGFAAYANDGSHNIIVLRGTVTAEEAGYDLYGWDTNTACMLPSANPTQNFGNVKQDLYDFYTSTDEYLYVSLAASFNAAVQQVASANPGKPWLVTAHSLGGALATLGALDAYVSGSYGGSPLRPWLVTFGSLHLGDQQFADAFNKNILLAYRFANLCDFVPSFVSLEPYTPPDRYVHVGLECTFVWQTWDDWANHSMQHIYLKTVRDYWDVIEYGPRKYPQ